MKNTKPVVTSLIKSLEKNGFLERELHLTDKRCFYLTLSSKSKQVMPELNQIFENWSSKLVSDFSDEEKKFLIESLQIMINNSSF